MITMSVGEHVQLLIVAWCSGVFVGGMFATTWAVRFVSVRMSAAKAGRPATFAERVLLFDHELPEQECSAETETRK